MLREKRMLELLAGKGMTQRNLAAAIGVSPVFVNQVLKGRRRLSLKQSKRLIELFGADIVSGVINWEAMGIPLPAGV